MTIINMYLFSFNPSQEDNDEAYEEEVYDQVDDDKLDEEDETAQPVTTNLGKPNPGLPKGPSA